ncbi:hypothetical protein BRARA_B02645 [Brassica rapa]|uniref:RNase H type-1 domain-containing protein n=1 Tax=Brassica campestris TaxID=3711 RepID=A0A398AJ23_BRACM|nr:hypothetical protein BRARA_B02645 [Brassica rapa]
MFWAVESMVNMKQVNVIIETSSIEVREALINPIRFPNLRHLTSGIAQLLSVFHHGSLEHVSFGRNILATSTTESVIVGSRTQSYISQ